MNYDIVKLNETFKKYDENSTYESMKEIMIEFDPSILELNTIDNIELIMSYLNKISYMLYYYGYLCDEQQRILQLIEDNFTIWKAEKYAQLLVDENPKLKSEASKERFLLNMFKDEYREYLYNINKERHRLRLLKRVVGSLEKFSYQLHDLKDYNVLINQTT